jgi:glycine/D-amino acid oxidase-like deaminating enzyme
MKKVIVIGAGIIGASLAYFLAKAGAEVLVLDELDAAGGVATPNSWAWINASWGNPPAYVNLRMRAMAEWRGLAQVDDQLKVNWCGGLLWDLPEDQLRNYVTDRNAVGYNVELVDGVNTAKIEPRLKKVPTLAAYSSAEGAIEPVAATIGFRRAALSLGAQFAQGVKVDDFAVSDGKITGVRAGGKLHVADETVIAAGAQTAQLLAKIEITLNLNVPPGLLVHSEPCEKLLNGLIMAPELHMRQTAEGRLVAGSDFGGAQPGDDPASTADVLFSKMKDTLHGAENLKMDFFTLGYRPTPADGIPALGRPSGRGGLYVCVTHSGVTLAPALGMLCADEILHDVSDQLLSPFHLDRLCS